MLCRCSTRSYFFPPFCSLALRPLFSCSPRIIDRRLLLRMERSLCQRFIPTFEDVKVSHSRLGFLSSSSQTAPFKFMHLDHQSKPLSLTYLQSRRLCSTSRHGHINGLFFAILSSSIRGNSETTSLSTLSSPSRSFHSSSPLEV